MIIKWDQKKGVELVARLEIEIAFNMLPTKMWKTLHFQVETNRVLQLLKKNQVSDKTVQNLIDKYVEHYKLNRNEKNTIDQKIRVECSTIQKQTGKFNNINPKV